MVATFFGGAINDTTTNEYKDSILIGTFLAENNYRVFNGGYRGLMEAVSKGAVEAGGKAYGFTCSSFGNRAGNEYLTYERCLPTIYDRLEHLIEDIRVFIVQKGGIGTLSELFLTWDVYRKKKDKPKIFLIGEHWNAIISSIEVISSLKEREMLILCKDFEDFKTKFN